MINDKLPVWNALYDICRAYPATLENNIEQKHLRVNTFAVVSSQTELEASNLGKDDRYRDKRLFFSRLWEETNFDREIEWEYPLLAAWLSDNSIRQNALKSTARKREQIVLAIIDRNTIKDPGESRITGTSRTFEEVERDLANMIDYVLRELKTFVYATVIESATYPDPHTAWFPEAYLNTKLAASEIASVNITDYLSNYIVGENMSFTTLHSGFLANDVSVQFVQLTLNTDICLVEKAFNYDMAVVPPFEDEIALYRLNLAGDAHTDADGNEWLADDGTYFDGEGWGEGDYWWLDIQDTEEDDLYRTFRFEFGFHYIFPVPNGTYRIHLHFAENVQDEVGDRIMNIEVNDVLLLENYDIVASAGGGEIADVQVLNNIEITTESIDIYINDVEDTSQCAAIEIIRIA